MYFPYLRSKQAEMLAVRQADFLSDLTVPIFEPVNSTDVTVQRWSQATEKGRRLAIITNSENGDPRPTPATVHSILERLPTEAVFPALEIRAGTPPAQIRKFSERFESRTCIVIHRNHLRQAQELYELLRPLSEPPVHILIDRGRVPLEVVANLPARGRVLLRDGFDYHRPNKAYPPVTPFDTLFHTFPEEGFDGFGDFTIAGDRFPKRGGGAANCIALHVTEITRGENPAIVTNHFKSDEPHVSGDNPRKYLAAVGKLVKRTGGRPEFDTAGVRAFHQTHTGRHNPGFEASKRWGILHHLEIVDRYLVGRGAFL